MSLGQLILEDGLELEIKADMKTVIELLDTEVPSFSYDDYGYRIRSLRSVMGSEWRLAVKPWDIATATELAPTVGLIEMDKLEGGLISFRVPPRNLSCDDGASTLDDDGKLLSSFVFQLLNLFQSRGLIDLPGQLPVR